MRVTVFHPAFRAVGGAEILALEQARWLAQASSAEVDVTTFAFDEQRWRRITRDLAVRVVPKRHWTDLLSGPRRSSWQTLRAQRLARSLEPTDLVLAHNDPCPALLGLSGVRARTAWYCHEPPRHLYCVETNPYLVSRVQAGAPRWAMRTFGPLVSEWTSEERAPGASLREMRRLDRDGVARLDVVVANSAYCRQNAEQVYGRSDVQVVPPLLRFPAERSTRRGIDRTRLRVLVQTRLDRMKNVAGALRGFAEFRRSAAGSGATLDVVGDGTQFGALRRLAVRLGLWRHVRFHGFLAEDALAALRSSADVFLLLPIDEPFGLVFPESAAHGLLLVGPDHGGPLEILEGGRFGWTCDPFEPRAVAAALEQICRLSDDEVERRREEADRAVRQRYAPDSVGPLLAQALGVRLRGAAPGLTGIEGSRPEVPRGGP
jgi:glycosyltransferase involved in cell wall biosynthesis